MIVAELVLGAPNWLPVALALGAVGIAIAVWNYWRATSPRWVRVACFALKALGIALLAICLVDPLYVGERPTPGSNLFLVVIDNSRSMQLTNSGQKETRAGEIQASLAPKANWLTRLSQDFDVRRYAFDTG